MREGPASSPVDHQIVVIADGALEEE